MPKPLFASCLALVVCAVTPALAQAPAASSPSAQPTAAAPTTAAGAPATTAAAPTLTAAATTSVPSTASSTTGLGLRVETQKLKNGLTVVMVPDATVPTVAVAVYFDVGSRNEQKGRSGFAHLFEHMMFQGSANVAKGEHFQLVMNRGGSVNGTTSHDRTNYFETLPSNELALGLWLEADRMRSLAVTQENFENQRETVKEERRQSYDNRPYMTSMLRINELAYGDYFPYAHSTIGDMEDLNAAPLADVQAFFRTYYAPNNAVIGIAGDFIPEQAMALVQKYFGDLPRRDIPAYAPGELAKQTAERTETMTDPLAELPAFHLAFHVPPDRSPDHYPLELLAIVLGDGESSRLYQELVKEKEVVQEVEVSTDGRRGPDLFSVWAICAQGHEGKEARSAFYRHMADIKKWGVNPRELQKAKNRVRSAFIFGLESNLARAQHFAEFQMYHGDAKLLLSEADRYMSVTNEDIKRVANTYFVSENRTVLDVVPPATAATESTDKAASTAKPGAAPATQVAKFAAEVQP